MWLLLLLSMSYWWKYLIDWFYGSTVPVWTLVYTRKHVIQMCMDNVGTWMEISKFCVYLTLYRDLWFLSCDNTFFLFIFLQVTRCLPSVVFGKIDLLFPRTSQNMLTSQFRVRQKEDRFSRRKSEMIDGLSLTATRVISKWIVNREAFFGWSNSSKGEINRNFSFFS